MIADDTIGVSRKRLDAYIRQHNYRNNDIPGHLRDAWVKRDVDALAATDSQPDDGFCTCDTFSGECFHNDAERTTAPAIPSSEHHAALSAAIHVRLLREGWYDSDARAFAAEICEDAHQGGT